MTAAGTFALTPAGFNYVLSQEGAVLKRYTLTAGSLTLTTLDTNAKKATGTFSFTAVDSAGATITATSGQFSVEGFE